MEIVIVDDEPVSLTVMKQLVAKLPSCEVHAFTNPSAALIWCTNNTPDLVLVDYTMPTMDGIEFARRVRALPTGRPDVFSSLSRLEVQARSRAPLASMAAFKLVQALAQRLVTELAPAVPPMNKRDGEEWERYQSATVCQD